MMSAIVTAWRRFAKGILSAAWGVPPQLLLFAEILSLALRSSFARERV
jgi:hypothetical protein